MRRGRTREFDTEQALDVALELFWRHGYEGTSIAELTEAMGINPPSLYAAFGNKRQLFQMVADRYLEGRRRGFEAALGQPTAHEVAEAFLADTLRTATLPGMPAGCFNVQAALVCGEECADVRDLLAERRVGTRTALQERFKRAVASGDLPGGTNCAMLARYLTTVAEGLNVQAAEGATRTQLRGVVATALRGFDGAVAI